MLQAKMFSAMQLVVDATPRSATICDEEGGPCKRPLSIWCSLPPEILGDIFLYVRDSAYQLFWLRSTHVCVSWRSAALGYALLWTCVDLRRRLLASEMIPRARGAPITLRLAALSDWELASSVETHADTSLEFKDEISHAISSTTHIRHIDFNNINAGGILSTEALAEIIAATSPHIRSMKLHTVPNDTPWIPKYALSPKITGTVYPLLETLHLCDCKFDNWRLPFLAPSHNLRSLRIQYSSLTEEAAGGNLAAVLDVLRGLPRLKDLSLGEYALPDYYQWEELPLELLL